jgi:sugar lactone lactonase YvrE
MREPLSVVANTDCQSGAGPVYHPDRGVVYWVDSPGGELFEYDPITDEHDHVLDYDGSVGGFTIQADGDLLLFCDYGRVVPFNPAAGLGNPVVEELDGVEKSQFSAVIADPAGGVVAGTTPTGKGSGRLSRLDADGSITTIETGIGHPKGMGFTPDRDKLYVATMDRDAIYRYEYAEATGDVSNRQVAVDASDVVGHPAGIAVDSDGHVWAAFWDGGRVTRYAPSGSERERIELPVPKVSAVAFGGPAAETAYVTTARAQGDGDGEAPVAEQTGAGSLFAIDPRVSGVPEFRSRVEI